MIQTIKAFGQCVNGTYTIGLDLSGTPGIWQFDGTIGISIDTKGNVAVQGALLVGPTSSKPAGGILEYKTITTASSVYDLEGLTTQVGGSVSEFVKGTPVIAMVGGEFLFIGDINGNGTYDIGATFSEGIAFGTGKEVHVQWGNTETIYSINIFDIWDSIYQKKLKS